MEAKYPGSPLAVGEGGNAGNQTTTARLPLDALEQCVAETCARDVARMQCLRTMYTSYRYFKLIHGTKGRDTPRNIRPNEVCFNSLSISPSSPLRSLTYESFRV